MWDLGASGDLDYVWKALWSCFVFVCFFFSPYFSCLGGCCRGFPVELQERFVDYETSPDFPSTVEVRRQWLNFHFWVNSSVNTRTKWLSAYSTLSRRCGFYVLLFGHEPMGRSQVLHSLRLYITKCFPTNNVHHVIQLWRTQEVRGTRGKKREGGNMCHGTVIESCDTFIEELKGTLGGTLFYL